MGFPHSEIPGSSPACGSPRLIAACHVLHRLLLPRHPPCALSNLTIKFTPRTHLAVTAQNHFWRRSNAYPFIPTVHLFGRGFSGKRTHLSKFLFTRLACNL